jgi:hypothetical protein
MARYANGNSAWFCSGTPGIPPEPTTMSTPPHEMANVRAK